MSDNTTINNAIIVIVLTNILTALGAWITARINTTSEKPTDIFIKSLQEARNQIAIYQRQLIEANESMVAEKRKRKDVIRERDEYARYALELREVANRYAPRGVRLPELEGNGTTPPDKE